MINYVTLITMSTGLIFCLDIWPWWKELSSWVCGTTELVRNDKWNSNLIPLNWKRINWSWLVTILDCMVLKEWNSESIIEAVEGIRWEIVRY